MPPGDEQLAAYRKTAFIGCEKDHRPGNLSGVAKSLSRDLLCELRFPFLRHAELAGQRVSIAHLDDTSIAEQNIEAAEFPFHSFSNNLLSNDTARVGQNGLERRRRKCLACPFRICLPGQAP